MAYYSGINGALYINGTKAGQVRNWTLNSAVQTLDTTALNDTDRTIISGLRSTNGTCTILYHTDPAVVQSSACALIDSIIKQRTVDAVPGIAPESDVVTMKLLVNDGSTAGRYVEGEVVLTSASMSMMQGEVFGVACTFEFNGAPSGVTL